MAEKTLAEEIAVIVNSEANNNPAPVRCKITKIYDDNKHVDAETTNGTLTYAETISNNLAVGNVGIVAFLNGDINDYIIITK